MSGILLASSYTKKAFSYAQVIINPLRVILFRADLEVRQLFGSLNLVSTVTTIGLKRRSNESTPRPRTFPINPASRPAFSLFQTIPFHFNSFKFFHLEPFNYFSLPRYQKTTMSQTVVLITGANRGIGKSILELYLQKPNHTVIAATRDPNHATSQALINLPKAEGTDLLIIKIDATSPTDPTSALDELSAKGIDHVDILIANAGISLSWPRVSELKIPDLQEHMDVNVYGLIYLYQAFRGLLKQAKEPKWISIGSSAACLTVR